MEDLKKLADKVTDEKSFINFIENLAKDRLDEVEKEKKKPSSPHGPGANGWENRTIENFLESAASWGADSIDGFKGYKKPNNPWTRCAHILFMGKIYE